MAFSNKLHITVVVDVLNLGLDAVSWLAGNDWASGDGGWQAP